jgi:hypothetical protein
MGICLRSSARRSAIGQEWDGIMNATNHLSRTFPLALCDVYGIHQRDCRLTCHKTWHSQSLPFSSVQTQRCANGRPGKWISSGSMLAKNVMILISTMIHFHMPLQRPSQVNKSAAPEIVAISFLFLSRSYQTYLALPQRFYQV